MSTCQKIWFVVSWSVLKLAAALISWQLCLLIKLLISSPRAFEDNYWICLQHFCLLQTWQGCLFGCLLLAKCIMRHTWLTLPLWPVYSGNRKIGNNDKDHADVINLTGLFVISWGDENLCKKNRVAIVLFTRFFVDFYWKLVLLLKTRNHGNFCNWTWSFLLVKNPGIIPTLRQTTKE